MMISKGPARSLFLLSLLLALLLPIACAPAATGPATQVAVTPAVAVTATEPSALTVVTSPAESTAAPPPPSPTILIYAYPGAPGHTPTPDPYPLGTPTPTITWTPGPTWTPEPTWTPAPTRPPEPTYPPLPTLGPTPVVTVVPTAAPPFIPFAEGTTAQPFTIYYRAGDAIYSLSSAEGAAPQLFLDPAAELGHLLTPDAEIIREWGALSPNGQTLALVLTDDPVSKVIPNGDAFSPAAPHPLSIYLFDMTTRALRLLVTDGFRPVWSPDGQLLAYRSTQTRGLWVVDVAGGAAHEVYAVEPPAYGEDSRYAEGFSWAFDNRRLAVFHVLPYESRDLLIVDADGVEAPRRVETELYHPFGFVQWSPVDDRLAYTRTGEGRQPLSDLWIMNGDLIGQRQLTRGLNFPSFGPLWSADGRWIVISGRAEYESEFPSYDLWLIELDSGAIHRLTYDVPPGSHEENDHDDTEGPFSWSPDDAQLVYRKEPNQLWVLSLIDGSQRLLLESEQDLYNSGFIVGP